MTYRLGVDVGGTFVDFALVRPDGETIEAKTPSRPDRHSEAIEAGLTQLAEKIGVSVRDLLCSCEFTIQGTTVATNALIQHQGPSVGLVTTEGFRDTLHFRQGFKE